MQTSFTGNHQVDFFNMYVLYDKNYDKREGFIVTGIDFYDKDDKDMYLIAQIRYSNQETQEVRIEYSDIEDKFLSSAKWMIEWGEDIGNGELRFKLWDDINSKVSSIDIEIDGAKFTELIQSNL